jgi:ABC-2 type transport system permease protein
MKSLIIIAVVAVVLAVRITMRLRRRNRTREAEIAAPAQIGHGFGATRITGDIALVATREIKERMRGRIFRVGTLIMLVVVAGAILIPKLTSSNNSSSSQSAKVGVVGSLPPVLRSAMSAAGQSVGINVRFVTEPSRKAADRLIRDGQLDLAIVNSRDLLVSDPSGSSNGDQVAEAAAVDVGVTKVFESAGLTAGQITDIDHAKNLPVLNVGTNPSKGGTKGTSVFGIIFTFLMLTQYNTWILLGVMEEKSSRVVEVLLGALRPIQLLAGKVLGIGTVALAQASAVVIVALVLGESVGSDFLQGTGALSVASTLVWLVLGYSFYCWVYAAAGSMAERQDQVQSLAFPLTIPIMIGYVFSLIMASTGNPSLLFKILAYIPLTAPFAMPTLVGLGDVAWWQFLASALISIGATFGVAKLAASIYKRSILRTGRRVTYKEALSGLGS